MKLLENSAKIAQIESRLTKYTYLSRCNLPGYPDGLLFQILTSSQTYPDRKLNPNFYHWYILMRQFAAPTISKWIQDRLYYDPEDSLIPKIVLLQTAPLDHDVHHCLSSHLPNLQKVAETRNLQNFGGREVEYIIDIHLKEYSQGLIEAIQRCLSEYMDAAHSHLQLCVHRDSQSVKINYKGEVGKYQEMLNLVSKSIEFDNLQTKKYKKLKTSIP